MASRNTSLSIRYDLIDNNAMEEGGVASKFPFFTDVADSTGHYATEQKVTINLTTPSNLKALTIIPADVWEIKVVAKAGQRVIYSKNVNLTPKQLVLNTDIIGYTSLEITVVQGAANKRASIQSLTLGVTLIWQDSDIKTATLVQEMNPLSDKLSINTLTFDIIDPENQFNFGNKSGIRRYIQKGQRIYPTEYINNVANVLGIFFIESVSENNNVGKINAVSYVGVLDKIDYRDGGIYKGTRARVLIEDIFRVAGITSYTISQEVGNKTIYGSLAPCSCREALRQVLFVCGGLLDTTSGQLAIVPRSTEIRNSISRNQKFSTKVELASYVRSMELKYSTYALNNEVVNLVSAKFNSGRNVVMFDKPCLPTSITVHNATLIKASTYYVEFDADGESTVDITGRVYEKTDLSIVRENDNYTTTQDELSKVFTTTLCDYYTAMNLMDTIFNHYTKNNLIVKISHIADDIEMNARRLIDNPIAGQSKYMGNFTKRTFNLTGGFLDNAELFGTFDNQDAYYYATSTGNELYTSDNFLI